MKNSRLKENYNFIKNLTDKVLSGSSIQADEAEHILSLKKQTDIILLLAHANLIRESFHGSRINLCAIVNAQSGKCSEDCRFCVQSAHYNTDIVSHSLLKKNDILKAAQTAGKKGIHRFSIVTSGKGVKEKKDFDRICTAVKDICGFDSLLPCASLGILTKQQFRQIYAAGLRRYHHNLESAESFFSQVCTTHSFEERVKTIRLAKEEGFEVCSGGIFGLGETPQQRIELAFTLKELDIDSVALNFLHPIPGTPFENNNLLPPLEILKAVAVFRFICPDKELRICGGREVCLKTLQPLMYAAGADGIMVGNYLTTAGRNVHVDLREITDMGLEHC